MNLTMQQPMSYPFYMNSPRLPWTPNSFYFPHPSQKYFPPSIPYPLPFILSPQPQQNLSPKIFHPFSSYTNTRYNHLKQATSYINRHRSIENQRYSIPHQHPYRTSKTNSVSDLQQFSQQNSSHLLKAHSWHSMNYLPNHPKEIHHQRSPKKSHTKQKQLPSDELPIITNPIYKENPKISSSSSNDSSHSSFQKRLNGSLRNDPLLNAAMEDFRQYRRTSSQSTSITPHQRDLSRDSLCSNLTHHSLPSSRSRSHSQSSFTSLERLEIRQLIKTLKTKGLPSLNNPFQSISTSQQIPIKHQSQSITSPNKPKKSSITEELDEQFSKLRSANPDEDLIYIKPSLIRKPKKSQPTETLIPKEPIHEPSSEYAILKKPLPPEVTLRSIKKVEQIRSFSFCKPIHEIVHESRPLSMFNWLHCGLTNPFPSTTEKSLVKENIYASDINLHLPSSNDKDYLNNEILIEDYLSNYKSTNHQSSILNDISRLFSRQNKHDDKCQLKKKLQKNNHHLRCSIM